jgi:formamidopyrimidine-DNA glycosylase
MPEGIEVYVLARVLKNIGIKCESYGKHLLLRDPHSGCLLDITFGLHGKISLTPDFKISKICFENRPCGDVNEIHSFDDVKTKLGIDWISASRDELVGVVRSWLRRKKKISALLVDQKEISGIGRYWVSKILMHAVIDPGTHAHTLEFLGLVDPLVNSMIQVRTEAVDRFMNSVPKDELGFVNNWCDNLYKLRT